MDAFPAFFPLNGARVVIAGSGEPAEARARLLEGSPAEVVRLDETWGVDPDAYQGATLIFIATNDDDFARRAEVAARTAGAPVNVFDRPQLSDFNTPAIIDRGSVVAAVGTTGAAPLLAQMIRADIEARLPSDIGQTAALLGAHRDKIRAAFPDLADRRAFLRSVLSNEAVTEATLAAALADPQAAHGRIFVVDLPAAEDLISLRAIQALGAAEAVAASKAAEGLLARHARRDAPRLDYASLGVREIVDLADRGLSVALIDPPASLVASLPDGAAEILCAAVESR